MSKSIFLKLAAAFGLAFASPAFGQISTIDPNDVGEYEPAASQPQEQPVAEATGADAGAPPPTEEYYPIDSGPQLPAAPAQQQQQPTAPAQQQQQTTAVPPAAAQVDAETRASAAVSDTVARDDVLSAAEGVFGRGAEGLAGLIEDILRKQGEPSAYITGREAGGAIVFGVRYGRGTLHHNVEGDRDIYWTGPSLGFDFGADANKVFVLVYNLEKGDDLFTRFGAAEGNAYVVGGFTASYLRRGDMVLIPVRMGVGLRLGVNAGYMRFSEKNRWLPF